MFVRYNDSELGFFKRALTHTHDGVTDHYLFSVTDPREWVSLADVMLAIPEVAELTIDADADDIQERRRWHLFRSEIPEPRTDPVVTPNTAIMVVTPRLADRIDTSISNLDREGLHHAASLINSSNSAFFARFVSHYDDANFHVRPVPRSAQEIAQCVVEVAGDFAAQIGQQSKEQVAEAVCDVMDPRQLKRTSNDCQGTVAGLTLTYNHSSATLTLFDRDEDEEEQLVSAFVFNQRFALR